MCIQLLLCYTTTNKHLGSQEWVLASLVFGGYEALFKLPPSCGRLLLSVMERSAAVEPERSQTPLSQPDTLSVPIRSPPPPHHPQPNYTVPQRNKTRWKPCMESQYESFNSCSLSGTEKEWDHKYNPLFRSLSLGRSWQGIDQTVALKGFNWPSLISESKR